MKLEANEDMNYVERIKEERSIFNEILENFFQEPDFNQKLKQFKETIVGIFHVSITQVLQERKGLGSHLMKSVS